MLVLLDTIRDCSFNASQASSASPRTVQVVCSREYHAGWIPLHASVDVVSDTFPSDVPSSNVLRMMRLRLLNMMEWDFPTTLINIPLWKMLVSNSVGVERSWQRWNCKWGDGGGIRKNESGDQDEEMRYITGSLRTSEWGLFALSQDKAPCYALYSTIQTTCVKP